MTEATHTLEDGTEIVVSQPSWDGCPEGWHSFVLTMKSEGKIVYEADCYVDISRDNYLNPFADRVALWSPSAQYERVRVPSILEPVVKLGGELAISLHYGYAPNIPDQFKAA